MDRSETMYYYICDICGSHLDPGERCDCIEIRREKERHVRKRQAEAQRLLEQGVEFEQQNLEF